MAEELLSPKSTGKKLGESFGVGASAVASEVIVTPFLGTNNLWSAGTKILAGAVISGASKKKMGEIIGTGVLVDGMINGINALLGSTLTNMFGKATGSESKTSSSIFV